MESAGRARPRRPAAVGQPYYAANPRVPRFHQYLIVPLGIQRDSHGHPVVAVQLRLDAVDLDPLEGRLLRIALCPFSAFRLRVRWGSPLPAHPFGDSRPSAPDSYGFLRFPTRGSAILAIPVQSRLDSAHSYALSRCGARRSIFPPQPPHGRSSDDMLNLPAPGIDHLKSGGLFHNTLGYKPLCRLKASLPPVHMISQCFPTSPLDTPEVPGLESWL